MKGAYIFTGNGGVINANPVGVERKAKPAKKNGNRVPDAERDGIAALIRKGLTLPDVARLSGRCIAVVRDVQADMWVGKHGGSR